MADRITSADVKRIAETCGITISTWAPGDGATRYRMFVTDDEGGTDYFGGSHPLGTTLGRSETYTWLQGYRAAQLVNVEGASMVKYG